MNNTMHLNKSQRLAVEHNTGPMLVLAGPGSGKTAVITGRIRYLIEEYQVPPEKILVVTFSRAAAVEMKQRFLSMTSDRYISVNFGTFHAVFFRIIKSAYRYDNSSIISEDERYRVIREAAHKYKIDQTGDRELIQKLSTQISAAKGRGSDRPAADFSLCTPEEFKAIYDEYAQHLACEGKLDFDDMMLLCLKLFDERPGLAENWQEKYEYILIDEFQDINELQYRLTGILAAPQNNIFAVGDDDQSIYGFRGARPDIMFAFERDYRGCRRILLDRNYRSHAEILEAASQLIGNNRNRFAKRITSDAGPGGEVMCLCFETHEEANDFILDKISSYKAAGMKLHSIAVLYRMNNEVRSLHRQLKKSNISCRLHEHVSCIFDHWIADDLTAYMELARGRCTRAQFLRIMNRPNRYITRQSVQLAAGEGEYVDPEAVLIANRGRRGVTEELVRLQGHLAFMRKLDVYAMIKYILYAVGYGRYLDEYASKHHIEREELSDTVAEILENAAGCESVEDWFERIGTVRDDLKKDVRAVADREDGVEMMTFHCSKGLEFEHVFIIDANEGTTPIKRAEKPEEIEEERRAFYVAMTRAKKRLYIISCKNRMGRTQQVSRFVTETGLPCVTPSKEDYCSSSSSSSNISSKSASSSSSSKASEAASNSSSSSMSCSSISSPASTYL